MKKQPNFNTSESLNEENIKEYALEYANHAVTKSKKEIAKVYQKGMEAALLQELGFLVHFAKGVAFILNNSKDR